MTDLPKRELGCTGLSVTTLGYGAMELRGAPRARDISEAAAEIIRSGRSGRGAALRPARRGRA
jgi:aryl-alcohol dehydrogenase-like predicted oxidoreductase